MQKLRSAARQLRVAVVVMAVAAAGLASTPPPAAAADVAPLSRAQAKALSFALKAAERRSWNRFERHVRSLKDHPLAHDIATWQAIVESWNGLGFEEVAAFKDAHADWPWQRVLERRVEELMPDELAPERVIDWFSRYEPVSVNGWEKWAEALKAEGDEAAARAMIRRTWVEANVPKARERSFYKKWRRWLTLDDHRKRLDRLIWEDRYWQAQWMLYRVDKDWQKLGQARLALARERGNVDYLVGRVPKALKSDAGLVFERLRWRRRHGLDTAADLLAHQPKVLPYPGQWWHERAILARDALERGHVTEAYRLASGHGIAADDAAPYSEAEWFAGWVALRFLRDHDVARSHFERMYAAVSYPISRARGAYWIGRAAEAAGDETAAQDWYAAAAIHPTTYYGQLATVRIKPGRGLRLMPDPEIPAAATGAFEAHGLVDVVRLLAGVGEQDRLEPFVEALARVSTAPEWQGLTARLARLAGRPDLSIEIAKEASYEGIELMQAGYPSLIPPRAAKGLSSPPAEPPLVLAVIRQESAFRPDAVSPASARGMMQLMPATAKRVARAIGAPYSRDRLLQDPDYNITLGHAYLSRLIEKFDGSYVLALAAYNAGPSRAARWVRQFGDPRDADVDAIDWVELIPFAETRNYVQRVLENLQVYRARLADQEVALALEDDLHQ